MEGFCGMDCKSIEKLIPKFIKNECTPKEETMFLEHIKECAECKEELTIEFLLAEGLNRLESGESFDLNAELEKRLKEKSNSKKPRRKWLSPELAVVLWDVIGGFIIVAVIVGLLVWNIL